MATATADQRWQAVLTRDAQHVFAVVDDRTHDDAIDGIAFVDPERERPGSASGASPAALTDGAPCARRD